ncbi:hypothetical protein [Streptantibioticus silvisoli]|uniref:Uncharacterized protein n=1 Tax=Streptantibioticus silvisoli TaxID=2705255 RepID=A0ABT6W4Z2_9ACTN|nr:hypothetical protein [Streptantibioticus silvisoli]MDI5965816.1 hypothetical protein [Streptantibioticus silvisoli]
MEAAISASDIENTHVRRLAVAAVMPVLDAVEAAARAEAWTALLTQLRARHDGCCYHCTAVLRDAAALVRLGIEKGATIPPVAELAAAGQAPATCDCGGQTLLTVHTPEACYDPAPQPETAPDAPMGTPEPVAACPGYAPGPHAGLCTHCGYARRWHRASGKDGGADAAAVCVCGHQRAAHDDRQPRCLACAGPGRHPYTPQATAPLHYDATPDPLDGCHWCACGNRWPCPAVPAPQPETAPDAPAPRRPNPFDAWARATDRLAAERARVHPEPCDYWVTQDCTCPGAPPEPNRRRCPITRPHPFHLGCPGISTAEHVAQYPPTGTVRLPSSTPETDRD